MRTFMSLFFSQNVTQNLNKFFPLKIVLILFCIQLCQALLWVHPHDIIKYGKSSPKSKKKLISVLEKKDAQKCNFIFQAIFSERGGNARVLICSAFKGRKKPTSMILFLFLLFSPLEITSLKLLLASGRFFLSSSYHPSSIRPQFAFSWNKLCHKTKSHLSSLFTTSVSAAPLTHTRPNSPTQKPCCLTWPQKRLRSWGVELFRCSF